MMKNLVEFWCSNWLAAIKQYLDLVYHADSEKLDFLFFLVSH